MEDFKQYGDLTEDELLELLHEIEVDDEDIQEAQLNASEKIAIEEEHESAANELPENNEIEAYYGNDAWRKLNGDAFLHGSEGQRRSSMAAVNGIKQKYSRLKEDRIRIQRFAFNQENIRLSDEIGKDNIKFLVSLLVQEHTRMVNKYRAFINKRLALLLNPFIPRRLRMCRMLYPDSVRLSPGFLYQASKEHGRGLTFWATPIIPYYFAQFTEQQIIAENKPEFMYSIDRAVSLYYEHEEQRAKKELKYASTLIQKGVTTYFDLLKLNPFWFELLYNNIAGNEQN